MLVLLAITIQLERCIIFIFFNEITIEIHLYPIGLKLVVSGQTYERAVTRAVWHGFKGFFLNLKRPNLGFLENKNLMSDLSF